MEPNAKLALLADAVKYDASCCGRTRAPRDATVLGGARPRRSRAPRKVLPFAELADPVPRAAPASPPREPCTPAQGLLS